MAIFHHPFTNIENYLIVSPFELDDFLSELRPRITLHTRGQVSKSEILRIMKDHEGACCQKDTAEGLSPKKEFGLTRNPNVQKKNTEEREKIEEKVK